ncbi:MAG: monovalent cation/H(+) antiporter subunit G [Microthrixaceae bacterium]
MADIIIGVLAIAGAVLVVLAGIGVVRFSDIYARMHAATKAPTVGIVLVGIAAALALDNGRAKILIAVAFIFITAPSAAHFVGRAAYRAEGIDIDLDARDDLAAMLDAPADVDGDGGGEGEA